MQLDILREILSENRKITATVSKVSLEIKWTKSRKCSDKNVYPLGKTVSRAHIYSRRACNFLYWRWCTAAPLNCAGVMNKQQMFVHGRVKLASIKSPTSIFLKKKFWGSVHVEGMKVNVELSVLQQSTHNFGVKKRRKKRKQLWQLSSIGENTSLRGFAEVCVRGNAVQINRLSANSGFAHHAVRQEIWNNRKKAKESVTFQFHMVFEPV